MLASAAVALLLGGRLWAQAPAGGISGAEPAALHPFVMDHRAGLDAHSPVDVSFLLEAPAGRHGFVHAVGGHLATEDGKRIRFWGVNLTEWSPGSTMIPAKEDAHLWAATLARYGVNCVRLQFLDLPAPRGLIAAGGKDTRAFDSSQMDREDYFLAELEKQGIYIDFNLLVGRPFVEGDGVTDAAKIHEGAKGVSLYDKTLIELQKEYARQLLGHINPYTGRSYANDPAVAIVEINNENAIWLGFRGPSGFYDRELDGIYNAWLEKGATAAEMWSLRKETGVEGGDPIPLLDGPEVGGAPRDRFEVESRFYLWLESSYFGYMRDYLRHDLGVRCVILATADHSHHNTGYPMLLATSSFDATDGHDYWQHPWERKVKTPMVDDPLNSTVVELSRTAEAGKPYTVSEVNEAFPNDYGAEQIPLLAAYAGMQDWDAVLWYTFEPKKDPQWQPYIGDAFDISLDPIKMPELAAGALTFLRGDVSPARETMLRPYSEDEVFDSYRLWEKDRPYFTPGFPAWKALEEGSRIESLNEPQSNGPTRKVGAEAEPELIVADTGELAWSWSKADAGQVRVDTPRTQALIGFTTGSAGEQNKEPANLTAEVENSFRVLVLTSLDGEPIAESVKMLLVAGDRAANTGMVWNGAHTGLAQWGTAPTLIEPVQGRVMLRGLKGARGVTVRALDGGGRPMGEPIRATRSGDSWEAPLGKPVTTWYAVTVER